MIFHLKVFAKNAERIHDTHGIEFLNYDISFKGICQKCRKNLKEE